jgi:hypothetical protein
VFPVESDSALSPRPPVSTFWKQKSSPINFEAERQGVTLTT